MLTIHRYYQQQLVLRTGQIFFAEVLFCSGLAWILIVGRGYGEGNCVPLFISKEENGTMDCGFGLGKADFKQIESTDGLKMQLKDHYLIFMFILTPISWCHKMWRSELLRLYPHFCFLIYT